MAIKQKMRQLMIAQIHMVNNMKEKYIEFVNKYRKQIYDAEKYIWEHPETGFNEWKTSAYLEKVFTDAGYSLIKANNIPGFYTDIDTGKKGPKIMIICELDALAMPNHFAMVNGCAHACGHHAQCAAMVGICLALKEKGALDNLTGSIRLACVPAEEEIQTEFREELRSQGIIHYLGGKDEFLYRGYFDGVDIAYMIHTGNNPHSMFDIHNGCNGNIAKDITFHGKPAHAGSFPQQGINALYAANLALNAINALRETFPDNDHVRVHPIITKGGSSVSVIPDEVKISTLVRGRTLDIIDKTNKKVNRAIASGALAMNATVEVIDHPGACPLNNSLKLKEIASEVFSSLVGKENVNVTTNFGSGSTDMGNLSCLMPVIHPYASGAIGKTHGDDFAIKDVENACVISAKAQILLLVKLLENEAELAKEVIASYKPLFTSKEEYFITLDKFLSKKELISYNGDEINIKI